MRRDLFSYHLPEELIARQPTVLRRGSRLLCLDGETGQVAHRQFVDLPGQVRPGDLLVFNNTRVIPVRLFGEKATGGKLEVLLERITGERTALAHVRASKSPKPGSTLSLRDQGLSFDAEVIGREDDLFDLRFTDKVLDVVEQIGHMPLPPYIDRDNVAEDRDRYQTVYAQEPGAVAAPTAGLHFDQPMLVQLQEQGVEMARVTLHVGAGTFQPVRVEDIRDHQMHSEWLSVDQQVCDQVNVTRARGGRVIAVGTTSVRCLETAAVAAESGEYQLSPYQGETDIFIYPGYEFKLVDALLTNFHLPESTLLMLVSAFSGYRRIMAAYREAVAECYRFFSYGDAMLLTKNANAPEDIPA